MISVLRRPETSVGLDLTRLQTDPMKSKETEEMRGTRLDDKVQSLERVQTDHQTNGSF